MTCWRRAGEVALAMVAAACSTTERSPAADAGVPDAANEAGPAPAPGRAPPPLSGGTLLVSRDGAWAVAADPDVDAVYGVSLRDGTTDAAPRTSDPRLAWTARLASGEEPGRLAEDGSGRVHVVLRAGSAIATIDLATGRVLARRLTCPEPRGIAYEEATDRLHVACASGDLVTLDPASGRVDRRVHLDVDLRDVVVVPGGLVVSRFKTAELLRVDASGAVVSRTVPKQILRGPQDLSAPANDPLDPGVAWRTVADGTGRVFVLHQYALARPIDLRPAPAVSRNPYAALGSCGGIVEPTVSTLSLAGDLDMGMPVPTQALSVDVSTTPDGSWLAIAHPGSRSDEVTYYRASDLASLGRSPVRCAEPAGRVILPTQAVAVALLPGVAPAPVAPRDFLIVQTRQPDGLSFFDAAGSPRVTVMFHAPDSGYRYSDEWHFAGHSLFHYDAGHGIACAQCHPEGGEDGRVWQFLPVGARRTPALRVGLSGTEPFHWSGDLADFDALLDDTFVRRMGGLPPSDSDRRAVRDWVFGLRAPTPMVDPGSEAVARGRALFQSDTVGCTACHDGPRVAVRANEDVGVASPERFQVPALRGVGYRAPFLHDGCAKTLRERFDPACGGGDRHGHTSQLSEAEIGDLVAYLESL